MISEVQELQRQASDWGCSDPSPHVLPAPMALLPLGRRQVEAAAWTSGQGSLHMQVQRGKDLPSSRPLA